MPVRLDLADITVARAVLALQRESYAVEAALIGDDRIPTLTETLAELRAAGLLWLASADDLGLTGAVAWKVLDDGTVDIHRLVVAPRAFRRGVASALLDALDATYPDRVTVVSTGTANEPALRLYRGRGFRTTSERDVIPGLSVTELERRPHPPGI
jgi:ribosomal protein S18 acetylase RimI-like enzyme